MLEVSHKVAIPKKGDFLVDEKYTFEVAGKSKGFKQIKDLPNSFVVADDIEIAQVLVSQIISHFNLI